MTQSFREGLRSNRSSPSSDAPVTIRPTSTRCQASDRGDPGGSPVARAAEGRLAEGVPRRQPTTSSRHHGRGAHQQDAHAFYTQVGPSRTSRRAGDDSTR
jgi:hypothetical protein